MISVGFQVEGRPDFHGPESDPLMLSRTWPLVPRVGELVQFTVNDFDPAEDDWHGCFQVVAVAHCDHRKPHDDDPDRTSHAGCRVLLRELHPDAVERLFDPIAARQEDPTP